MVSSLHQLRDTAVGRNAERVPLRQRTSGLYLRRFRGKRGGAKNDASDGIYRACPLTTRPRAGDLICQQRESELADASDAAVRERIRTELDGSIEARSVRRTHCDVVAHVDKAARKVYTIGGNVSQAVTARKMNLRRDLTFSASQKGNCGGPSHWSLPQPAGPAPHGPGPSKNCSLNDKKWFVLLQLR